MSLPKSFPLLLAFTGWASAQAPPIPGFPGAGVEGPVAPQNLTQALKKPDLNAIYPAPLEFPTATAYDIAAIYQNATGKRVIVPTSVKDVQFAFIQSGGLTNREVADLIEQFLLIEGYQLNPFPRNPDIVALLSGNQPGGPAGTAVPVKVLTEPSQLALETGVVSYVMRFQYIKPEEAQRVFTQVYGQFRPGGTIAEVKNASSLVITEKAPLIQSLFKLKEEIDVPSTKVATDWVAVQYADVQQLAEQLNEMFNAQQSQNQSARVQRQPAVNTPPIPGLTNNAAGSAGSGGGEESPPVITPDTRTNRIFLMGRPVDLVFIKEIIAKWDVESDSRNFLSRQLKYLPVAEFVGVAEQAINTTLGDGTGAAGGAGGGARSTANRNTSNNGFGGNNNRNTNNRNNNAGGIGGQNGGGGGGASAALGGQDGITAPEAFLVGRTLLVADNVSNSLIVQGPPHHIEIVENLLDKLDVKNPQVAIEAVFARYSVTDGLTFGMNLGQLLNGNGIGFATGAGGGGSITENVIGERTILEFSRLVAPSTGLAAQGISGDFGVFVNALETYTNFKAFARPTIFTTNNREARISSGTQIAIPTNTFQNNLGNGGQSTNVEYRDVALELLVRPLLNSDTEVTLEISIVRDTVGEDRDVGELIIPDLLSDQLDTIVTVPIGSAVLLGGLIDEDVNETDSGVPILRAIPLIGGLFRNNDDQFRRSELVIMIRPTLVDGKIAINQYQDQYDYSSNLSGEARAQFNAPRYTPRENSAVDRIFNPNKSRRSAQVQPQRSAVAVPGKGSAPANEARPSSPIQKALFDKKRRLEQQRR